MAKYPDRDKPGIYEGSIGKDEPGIGDGSVGTVLAVQA